MATLGWPGAAPRPAVCSRVGQGLLHTRVLMIRPCPSWVLAFGRRGCLPAHSLKGCSVCCRFVPRCVCVCVCVHACRGG